MAPLVVFDCDGVLVDSEFLVIELEAQLLNEAGFDYDTDTIAERFVGLSYPDMVAAIEADYAKPVPAGLSERIQQAALDAFPDRLEPVAGMPALLAGLGERRCLASSSKPDRIALSLAITGLDAHFDANALFSSTMVRHGKPAPDLFLYAAKALNTDPASCVVVEDSPYGVAAAVAAGMPVIGFTAGRHARPSLTARLQAAGATHIAATADELAHTLSSLTAALPR